MRVALLTNILTPYRIPVYRALSDMSGADWRVFVNAQTEFDRAWDTDPGDLDVERVKGVSFVRRFAFGGSHASQRVTTYLPFGLFGSLRRFRPDTVVSAELGARTLFAWLFCAWFRIPLVIWSYHSRVSATASPPMRALRRGLLARAAAVIGMGRQARTVLKELGVPDERVYDAPNAHDSGGIAATIETARPDALKAQLRRRGCRERIVLVVGRLVEGKGIEQMLEAWRAIPAELRASWSLVFLGDGPIANRVRGAADQLESGELLHCAAVEPARVVDYYCAADMLAFPSLGDPWGLVVNEAMACGLPVVCSSRAGCSDDLIIPGENGWLADPLCTGEWTAALSDALTHPDLGRFFRNARRTAARFGPDQMAMGIANAVWSTVGGGSSKSAASAGVLLERPPE